MRQPLVLPAAALVTGITISCFVPFENRDPLAAIAAFLSLALLAFWRGSARLGRICLLLAACFAGILLETLHRPGPPPELDARPREILILSGCVVKPPVFFEDREQFVLELAPKARVRVNLYLREGERPPDLRYGQRVEVEARVRSPRNFGNPGSFDYAGYLARQHIYWTASARPGSPVHVLEGDCGSRFWGAIYRLRASALARLERLYGSNPYALGMMQALLIGDKSKVEKVWTDHFRFTGTYHALVISGLHLTALAAVVLFFLRLCAAGEGTAFAAATTCSWLYALVTGWHTPVVRAASGLTLYLAARYFYRRHSLLNLLAAVATAFLIRDPHQLFEPSFQLSFLCVTAIAALAVPLLARTSVPLARGLEALPDRDRDPHLPPRVAQFRVELRLLAETGFLLSRIPERWLLPALAVILRAVFYVYELIIVSAVVQIGLALPMAVYFHRVSFSGVSANVAVVPLMSLVVPIGFLAIFSGWSAPATVASGLLAASQKVVEWHVRREPAWRIPDPPLWLAILFSASLILLCLVARGPRWRRRATFALVAGLLALLLWHPFPANVRAGMLELTAIDVGQGESLLIAFPDGKLIVMDGGGFSSFGRRQKPNLDTGEDVVSPYLWSRSIRRLDVVAMSHAHQDHMGGLFALIDNFRPRELWTGATPETPSWAALRKKARQKGVTVVPLRGGQQFEFGGAQVEVLAPPEDYVPSEQPSNDDSLALRLSFGERAMLLGGDMEKQIERTLVERNLISRADVLKVAHHGSRTSTSEPFLEQVRPVFALMSLGLENHYNYPHPEVVARLVRHRVTAFRTDAWGLVSIRTDGRRFWMDTARWSRPPRGPSAVF